MKLKIDDIGGSIVKQDDRYIVKDNKSLNNLVLSSTELYPEKSTTGHSHEGQEEIYFFIRGFGKMQVGDKTFEVDEGDIVTIPDGAFHRVWNQSKYDKLYFICVFDGRRNH